MRYIGLILLCLVFSGCGHFRYVATSKTQPVGGVQTRNRYRLFQFCVVQKGKHVNLSPQEFASLWATFKSTVPNVFAEDGKPIAVYLDRADGREEKYGWTILFPYLLTLGILPMWEHVGWTAHYSIRFRKPPKVPGGLRNTYAVKLERDWNLSIYGPVALCIPYDDPAADANGQTFSRKQAHILGSTDQAANNAVVYSAIAYGAACTLRQLEEDGTLPEIWEETKDNAPNVGGAVPSVVAPTVPAPSVIEIDSIPL